VTLAIELGVPAFVFAPRRLRKIAFWVLTGLQTAIAATGNYAFFNVLTIALGLWILDDGPPRAKRPRAGPWTRIATELVQGAASGAVGALSVATFVGSVTSGALGRTMARISRTVDPFRSVNAYGLFAVMTTTRPEIVIEGSNDAHTWREYVFRYKPSRPRDPPRWVAPHQPRLDWQMWFAALGMPPAWFSTLLKRLLQGSPEVLRLFAENPFPDRPPRYLRALLYDYRMTDLATRRRTGAWWKRKLLGTYYP
jgi:hypothetical protein